MVHFWLLVAVDLLRPHLCTPHRFQVTTCVHHTALRSRHVYNAPFRGHDLCTAHFKAPTWAKLEDCPSSAATPVFEASSHKSSEYGTRKTVTASSGLGFLANFLKTFQEVPSWLGRQSRLDSGLGFRKVLGTFQGVPFLLGSGTGAPHKKQPPSWDPTIGLCPGPYGGTRERGCLL